MIQHGKTTAGLIPSLPLSLGMLTDQERKLPAMRVQLQLHCSHTQVVSTVTHGRRKSGYWISSLADQWWRKIVRLRGAEARRHAAGFHVSALLILNCLMQRIHPMTLCYCLGCTQSHFHQIQTNYQLLHFLQSYTCLLV